MESRRKLCASCQRPTSSEAGEGSRAPAERRSKHQADRLPELIIPPDLQLTRVRGVLKKFVQPRYVDFPSLEDMFEGMESLFATQGWTSFLKSHKQYSPTVVTKFFNNMGMVVHQDLYTTVKGVYRFCHGSVDRPIDGVDTGLCFGSCRPLVCESSHSRCGLSRRAQFGVVVLLLLFEPSRSVCESLNSRLFGVIVLQ
ncbi:hypothetical protein Taro_030403, partial [Colocasia esculenta]|nr:hypothetical protein [Colocasia esculenta]